MIKRKLMNLYNLWTYLVSNYQKNNWSYASNNENGGHPVSLEKSILTIWLLAN